MAAEMDENFQAILLSIRNFANENAMAALGDGQPAYTVFTETVDEPGPERFDYEMKDIFNDDSLVQHFNGERDGEGKAGDIIFYQQEHAMFSRLARDFRLRRRTKARIWAHGATRLKAMAAPGGTVTGSMLEQFKIWMMSANGGS